MKLNPKNGFMLLVAQAIIISLLFLVPSGCSNNSSDGHTDPDPGPDPVEEPNDPNGEDEQKRLEEERQQREEALREDKEKFFVPLPPLEQKPNPPVKARGIYVTGNSAALESRYSSLLNLVETTELNSMVIDVKNDHGHVTYNSSIEFVKEINSNRNAPIKDLKALLDDLNERDIYPIARVVLFKDPYLAEKRHDLAIQRSDRSGVWRDNRGVAWVNPYNREVWEYNLAVAREAALLGFREIQFDYVRFPENARGIEKYVYYPGHDNVPKDDIITEFLAYAREELEEYNVYISADVFGVIATSWGDSDLIGQTWEKIAPLVDYQCPMIYPSHYGPGYFGFPVPDANPEGIIRRALEDALKRNAPIKNPAIIRPWLQAFTASWIRGHIPYKAREVRLQIETALKLGIDEYLLWNAGNVYPEGGLLSPAQALSRASEIESLRDAQGRDYLGRTRGEMVAIFLDAVNKRNWREAYPIHGTGFTIGPDQYREMTASWSGRVTDYTIKTVDHNRVTLDLTITVRSSVVELKDQQWEIIRENHIWKVIPTGAFLDALVHTPEEEN